MCLARLCLAHLIYIICLYWGVAKPFWDMKVTVKWVISFWMVCLEIRWMKHILNVVNLAVSFFIQIKNDFGLLIHAVSFSLLFHCLGRYHDEIWWILPLGLDLKIPPPPWILVFMHWWVNIFVVLSDIKGFNITSFSCYRDKLPMVDFTVDQTNPVIHVMVSGNSESTCSFTHV